MSKFTQPRVNLQAEQEEVRKAIFGSPQETSVGLVQANMSSGGGEAETLPDAFTYCLLKAFLIKPLGAIAHYDCSQFRYDLEFCLCDVC